MKIYDISWPISPAITTYKNRNDVSVTDTKTWAEHMVRESQLCMSMHTGTHVDAPSHFVQDGLSIDSVPLQALVGPCVVLDMTMCNEVITRSDLQGKDLSKPRVLLKTRNSFISPTEPFNFSFVYVDAGAAEYLAGKEVQCVGIDYLGIERNQPDHKTHTALLSKQIPIIEGLRLESVEPGTYTLVCLPLSIEGVEAAPARAVLIEE